jgi:hypothetical protein
MSQLTLRDINESWRDAGKLSHCRLVRTKHGRCETVLKRLIAATVTLAVASTSVAAFVSPGAGSGQAGTMIIPVVEPVKKFNKPVVVQKRAPVIAKQRPIIMKPQNKVMVKKAPVIVKKAPVVVMKKPGPFLKGKPISKMPPQFVHVKQHRRHKWYGRAIGGVILGTILAGSAYYAYASPPADGLCWYWTNSDRERGYWDYCDPPEDD